MLRVARIVFVVTRKNGSSPDVNVVVPATDRERAKAYASHILGSNPDKYVVTPITKPGSFTTFILDAE